MDRTGKEARVGRSPLQMHDMPRHDREGALGPKIFSLTGGSPTGGLPNIFPTTMVVLRFSSLHALMNFVYIV